MIWTCFLLTYSTNMSRRHVAIRDGVVGQKLSPDLSAVEVLDEVVVRLEW